MKKIFSSILISFILLLNISIPISVLAAAPTIKLNLVNEQQNGETGQWSWVFDIKTTNIPDGEVVTLGLSKNGVKEGLLIKEKITNNSGSFYTDSTDTNGKPGAVLLPLTKYLVVATYLNASDSFEKTTPEGIRPDIIKQGNPYTAIGSTAIKDTPTPVSPKSNVTENNSIYTMLAPIGGITCMDSSGQDPKCISNDIGKYLNVIFKLAIGICAALAVIMLIINGIKYMGDESVFGKTEAKKQMFGAIVGLLIALGAWALLNTINPALTGQNGLNISSANIEIEEPPMVVESTGIPALGVPLGTSGTQNYCPDGRDGVVVGNKTIMNTCKTISSKITKLINDALAQNIKLSGASFRSYSDQKQARINNKCPDVLTSPPGSCKPPTAIPGTSMHEGGLAIDFQCNGQIIKTTDNECFIWLTKNAQSAGLKNYAKEPWHWSTNGK